MRCPRDGSEMGFELADVKGHLLPYRNCSRCQGSFVEGDEVEKFARERRLELTWNPTVEKPRATFVHCPSCVVGLNERTLEGIQLDLCPNCHGVWFDAKELRKFRRKGRPLPDHAPPAARGDPQAVRAGAWFAMGYVLAMALRR